MPAGIGVDLRPVKRHCAHLQHAHLTRQQQHLHKQVFDLLHKAPSERGDRVVIGMLVGRDKAHSHRIVRRPFQLTARKHPGRVAINQDAQQHRRMVRRRTRTTIVARHRSQVQTFDHLHHKDAAPEATRPPRAAAETPSPDPPRESCSSPHRLWCTHQQAIPHYGTRPHLSPTGC